MPKKTRTPAQRESHLPIIAEAYLRGNLQSEIAKNLGLSRQQIGYDLADIRKRWLASALRDFDEAKAQELAKLDNLERTYWQGWDDSRKDRKRTTEEKHEDPAWNKEKTELTTSPGDPRFLDGVRKCVEQRCRILGLEEMPDINNHVQVILLNAPQVGDDEWAERFNGRVIESETDG